MPISRLKTYVKMMEAFNEAKNERASPKKGKTLKNR